MVHRWSDHECPFQRCVNILNDRMHILVPAVKIVRQLLGRAFNEQDSMRQLCLSTLLQKFMISPRRIG
jgi:hypothetical protein